MPALEPSFPTVLLWLFLVLLSFLGYGGILTLVLRRHGEMPHHWGFWGVWGCALSIAAGGILNLMRRISVQSIVLLVGTGSCCWSCAWPGPYGRRAGRDAWSGRA